jgi:Arc/MetJ-type ribon-helix-helix transcriptional regulator
MDQMQPINVRLSPEQRAWLDEMRGGPIVTRSEALRHVLADAMQRDARRRRALTSKIRSGNADA